MLFILYISFMSCSMNLKMFIHAIFFCTHITIKRLFTSMNDHVLNQFKVINELFVTKLTINTFTFLVVHLVTIKIFFRFVASLTYVTFKNFRTKMSFFVFRQSAIRNEEFFAYVTLKLPIT